MAYKNPESKREGCYYPNCSGYLEVPFCCHDPKALPALKARLAQLETPKREWVGLTDDERNEMIGRIQHDQYTRQRDLIGSTQIITEMYLKEKNT